MKSQSLRPGFRLEGSYNEHVSPVRQVIFNSRENYYISLDDKCVRAWRPGSPPKQLAVLNFPAFQPSFITCMVYSEKLGLIFAAALDNSIKLYCSKLRLKASLPWKAGAVLSMVYNSRNDELVAAGSDGVKVWYSEPDYSSYYTNDRGPFERAQKCTDSGKLLSWSFGQHQTVMERMVLRVPCSNLPTKNASGSRNQPGEWCHRLVFYESSQLLLVMVLGNIYGFNLITGHRVYNWEGLHTQTITGVVYLPHMLMVFTSSQDATVAQWRLMVDGSLQVFKRINSITTPVSGMVLQDDGQAILTSTLDGMITLWSLESLEAMFRMKVPGSVIGLTFQGEGKFFFHYGNNVKVMHVKHIFRTLRVCNSRPVHIHCLNNEQILVLFEDSSLRVMDENGNDVFTTVPQLSTKTVLEAEYVPSRRQLVVLLGNGHIHIWHIRSRHPPKLAHIWSHLLKERPCSLRVLMRDFIPPCLLSLTQGKNHKGEREDLIILGTISGDLLLCELGSGNVLFRTPGFEKDRIRSIAVDMSTENMLLHSSRTVKIFRLGSLSCASEITCNDNIAKTSVLAGRGLIGGQSGSLVLVDLCSGCHIPTTKTFDHLGMVTAISTHHELPFFLTASKDGWIRMLDRDKALYAMLLVAEPVDCVCFLNTAGDILVGVGNRLLVARSTVYGDIAQQTGHASQNKDGEAELQLSRYSSGFNVWRTGSASAPRVPSSPRSFPRKALAVDLQQTKLHSLSMRRPVRPIIKSIAGTHSSQHSDSSTTNEVTSGVEPGQGGESCRTKIDSNQNVPLPPIQYTVELPLLCSMDNAQEEHSLSLLSSHVTEGKKLLERSYQRTSPDGEGDESCETGSTDDQAVSLSGLEESFKNVVAVIESSEAFYPGLLTPIFPARRRTKKKKKGGRRRKRKKGLITVGLSWDHRAEELRKCALESKVILGVHELKAEEARTKPAVKKVLPISKKLASVTLAQPMNFVPRSSASKVNDSQDGN